MASPQEVTALKAKGGRDTARKMLSQIDQAMVKEGQYPLLDMLPVSSLKYIREYVESFT